MSVSDEAVPGFHSAAAPERSDELARRLIGAMSEGVLVFDQDGSPIMANAAAIEIAGISVEQLAGGPASEPTAGAQAAGVPASAGAPEVEPEIWEQLRSHLREDPGRLEARRIEGTGRRSDGREFPFEASVFALGAGEHQFFVAFVHDIADRKAAERRLADARDAALRASVVKSEFLATMSHEIRTPMNGVIGSLDLMLDSELAPELTELAQIARTAANDLLVLIDDILDLSKIEADKVEIRREEVDLVAIVEGVADIVALSAREKRLALGTYIDPEIPPGLRGDPRLLRQVLVNLVGNAVKFTDRGEVVVRVERQPAPAAQALLRFSVRDTGAGIPPEAVESLFEPFTQVDSSAGHEHAGSGLGLAISSRLVRLMGGRLAVESEPGRGSVFSFDLPFERSDEGVEESPSPARLGPPLRVLLIDDSETSAENIERYLRAWGMVATAVADVSAGLERLAGAPASERFDAVIVSGSLIEGDGQALAHRLRDGAGEHAAFLIELQDIGERRVETQAPASFDAVVGKPVRQARLREALATIGSAPGPVAVDELPKSSAALAGLRVLIAEDNQVNQQVLLRQVQRLGFVADAVNNGQEVLEALTEGTYDVVLMDCQMPVMDGYNAALAIRSSEQGGARRLPIVAVTANAMRDDFDRCVEAGMDEFVAKPVTLTALAGAIERATRRSRDTGAVQDASDTPSASQDGPPDGSSAAIDRPALDSLREDLGGPAALLRIVRLFLEQLDPQAEQIAREARAGELETLARNAHRMKSSAATLGASELAELLSQLEASAREGDAAACRGLGESFSAAVEPARAAFVALLDELDVEIAAEG